jgi:hypothetical protein
MNFDLTTGWPILLYIIYVASIFIGQAVGEQKGRVYSGLIWTLLFGPIGLIVVLSLPESGERTNSDENYMKTCPHCGILILKAARVCRFCSNCVENFDPPDSNAIQNLDIKSVDTQIAAPIPVWRAIIFLVFGLCLSIVGVTGFFGLIKLSDKFGHSMNPFSIIIVVVMVIVGIKSVLSGIKLLAVGGKSK